MSNKAKLTLKQNLAIAVSPPRGEELEDLDLDPRLSSPPREIHTAVDHAKADLPAAEGEVIRHEAIVEKY